MSGHGGHGPDPCDAARLLDFLAADAEAARERYADVAAASQQLLGDVEQLRWAACTAFGVLASLRDDPGLSDTSRAAVTATLDKIQQGQVPAPGTRHAWWVWCAAAVTGVATELACDKTLPEATRAAALEKLAAVYATRPAGDPESPVVVAGDR